MLPYLTYDHIHRELDIRRECAARIFHSIQAILSGSTNLGYAKINSEVLNGIYVMENDLVDTRKGLLSWLDAVENPLPSITSENRVDDYPSGVSPIPMEHQAVNDASAANSRDHAAGPSMATHFVSLGIWAPRLRQV